MDKPNYLVFDEFGQRWIIDEYDDLYEQAKLATEGNEGKPPMWSLRAIMEHKGWGWWSVWAAMEDVIVGLKVHMPDPMETMLVEPIDYSFQDLRLMLQKYAGYLAFLYSYNGRLKAQANALKKGYEGAIKVGTSEMKATTEKAKEATLLAGSELLRQTKRLDANQTSLIELIGGWIEAYEAAHTGLSRALETYKAEAQITRE